MELEIKNKKSIKGRWLHLIYKKYPSNKLKEYLMLTLSPLVFLFYLSIYITTLPIVLTFGWIFIDDILEWFEDAMFDCDGFSFVMELADFILYSLFIALGFTLIFGFAVLVGEVVLDGKVIISFPSFYYSILYSMLFSFVISLIVGLYINRDSDYLYNFMKIFKGINKDTQEWE